MPEKTVGWTSFLHYSLLKSPFKFVSEWQSFELVSCCGPWKMINAWGPSGGPWGRPSVMWGYPVQPPQLCPRWAVSLTTLRGGRRTGGEGPPGEETQDLVVLPAIWKRKKNTGLWGRENKCFKPRQYCKLILSQQGDVSDQEAAEESTRASKWRWPIPRGLCSTHLQ